MQNNYIRQNQQIMRQLKNDPLEENDPDISIFNQENGILNNNCNNIQPRGVFLCGQLGTQVIQDTKHEFKIIKDRIDKERNTAYIMGDFSIKIYILKYKVLIHAWLLKVNILSNQNY